MAINSISRCLNGLSKEELTSVLAQLNDEIRNQIREELEGPSPYVGNVFEQGRSGNAVDGKCYIEVSYIQLERE